MINMTIHHGEEVQQRNLPCDFLSLRMSLYQMNMMLAPNEVSVRDVQAEFTSTDPIGQKLISIIRPGDLLSDVDVAIHQLKAAPQAIQEAMRQRLLDGALKTSRTSISDGISFWKRSAVSASSTISRWPAPQRMRTVNSLKMIPSISPSTPRISRMPSKGTRPVTSTPWRCSSGRTIRKSTMPFEPNS